MRVQRLVCLALVSALVAGLTALAVPSAEAANRRLVSGWIPYWATGDALQSFKANANIFGDVSPFWHSLTSDTTVSDQETAADRTAVINAARAAGVPVVPAITDGTGAGRLAAALADPGRRATVVQTLVNLTVARGYDGLDLDLEGFAYTDSKATWATTRPNWVGFVGWLAGELHARGKVLYATIPPTYDSNRGASSGYWVYDYAGIASQVDRVRIMAYDYSVGSPGPIAPYGWVTRIVAYAVTQVPRSKLVLGIPAYGRDWVTSVSGTCPAGANTARRSLTARAAWQVAADHRTSAVWDTTNRERTFTYSDRYSDGTNTCLVSRRVWFSDGSAVSERARLAYAAQFASVALWSIGGEDSQTWSALQTLSQGLGAPLYSGQVLEVQVAGGSTGVPANAEAVSLNVTATGPNAAGFLTVYPCGMTRPGTSTVNYAPGQTVANAVIMGVGSGGKVCVFTSATAHVVVDGSGYFPAGSPFEARSPVRLTDTRLGVKPPAGSDVSVAVPAGIAAAALTITVTEPSAAGWAAAYPCGTNYPGTSTLNFAAGQTVAANALVRAGANGRVCIRTSASTHTIVDLTGVFKNGAGFTPLTSARLVDTRVNPGKRVAAGTAFAVTPGVTGTALALNVTVTAPVSSGWVQAYACGTAPPNTSTLNFAAGQTVANLAIAAVGSNGKICLRASAATHLVVDRTAAFGPGRDYYVAGSPRRLADTRTP